MKAERGPPKKRGRKPLDPEVAAARAKAKAGFEKAIINSKN